MFIVMAAAMLAGLPTVAVEPPQTWRIVGVHDGDTVKAIDAANVQHKIRLHGIDAPKIGQPFGNKARDRLASFTMGKAVEVHTHGQDKYGRTPARLVVEGTDVDAAPVPPWEWRASEKERKAVNRQPAGRYDAGP